MNTPLSTFLDFADVAGIALVVLLPPVVGALREHRVTRQIRSAERWRDADGKGAARAAGPSAGVVRAPLTPSAGAGVRTVQFCGR